MCNKSVLLVDDEQPILIALSNYLERNDFMVKPAPSGEDALAAIHSNPPFDLIITDLVMPGINGIEVLQEIRNENGDVGVFILTGHGNMTRAIEALRFGADDFLLKPCDAKELVFKMNHFFEKQEALKKRRLTEKFLSICMLCKKIRDDRGGKQGVGQWVHLEEHLIKAYNTHLSHGYCPDCFAEQLAEFEKYI